MTEQKVDVIVNAGLLLRAFEGVIDNAVRYTDSGGTISISTLLLNNAPCVEVRDSGIGIEEVDMPHIFDRFFRADKARQINSDGSKLGLAIIKRIIRAHDGHITVESTPRAGTCVRIIFNSIASVEA